MGTRPNQTPTSEEGICLRTFQPFTESQLRYFDQLRSLRPDLHADDPEYMTLRSRAKELQHTLECLAEDVLKALLPLRDDLEWHVSSVSGRLPTSLSFTITRMAHSPQTDAQLIFLLREEGAEVGFGFGLRSTPQHEPIKQKFFRRVGQFHRKASRYVDALLQKDYRLWKAHKQTFLAPSLTPTQWQEEEGVIVRLLDRGSLIAFQQTLPGIVAQLFGECLGLYGFLDRVYTDIPTIRSLYLESPDDIESIPLETDIHDIQALNRECIVDFLAYTHERQFYFTPELVRAYVLSLQTRPITILSGTSGTGKSQLATLFAQFLTEDVDSPSGNPHVAFVSVRPDWLDPQALLGYYDTLRHVYRPTPFLQLLLRAEQDPQSPYFAIIDELNLARVEYYLADLLSTLESRQYDARGSLIQQATIPLHDSPEPLTLYDPYFGTVSLPAALAIPPNVYITGTVNIDATTHRLSPKVLDRVNVLEVPATSPARYIEWLTQPSSPPIARSAAVMAQQRSAFTRHGSFTANYHTSQLTLSPDAIRDIADTLECIFQIMAQAGFSVGLRLVQAVLDFAENSERLYSPASAPLPWILDRQLLQTVLPRLHGTRQRMEPLLWKLLQLCWPQRQQTSFRASLPTSVPIPHQLDTLRIDALHPDHADNPPDMPASAQKIAQMLTELQTETYIDFHLYR